MGDVVSIPGHLDRRHRLQGKHLAEIVPLAVQHAEPREMGDGGGAVQFGKLKAVIGPVPAQQVEVAVDLAGKG